MSQFTDYLTTVSAVLARRNATEHTYRPALQALVQSLAPTLSVVNEPKRIACGAPDYIITRGESPVGYIEAKDIGVSLDKTEKSDQMKRYLSGLGNLILTDYVEFRWYVGGEKRIAARLGRIGKDGKSITPEPDQGAAVGELLTGFLTVDMPGPSSPRDLASKMARLARLIRDAINDALRLEEKNGQLHQQFEGFRRVLLHDLTPAQFADMYAQTIAYGLFAARCNAPSGRFNRRDAAYDLPRTNPFLRKLFGDIAGPDIDEHIVWIVDDLAELLARTEMDDILRDFGRRTRQEDPVVHFYETFLSQYDSKMREARGVYYTPEPVVGYIVRSVDHLLKTEFGLPDGLADNSKITVKAPDGKGAQDVHRVQILDPATGTGTFLHGVIDQIYESFAGNKGIWPAYVAEHLLPRLFGFELLMAPYAVAHLKLGLQLKETGYHFGEGSHRDERLRVYLTNTLEEADEAAKLTEFAQWVAEEANAASGVKQNAPVMVVLGNPPYSGHSANNGHWISQLLRGKDTRTGSNVGSYFHIDGEPLGERNPKWLNDDYVKFIRFAQWRIEQTGYGILAFISNHGYLDNPTFRGMRHSLMETFDDIYILDLHGNSKKKETTPEGGKDENVFDIQQGVAIGLFVKRFGAAKELAKVHHAELYGTRKQKYDALLESDVARTKWQKASSSSPKFQFEFIREGLRDEYSHFTPIQKILLVNVLGFQSHRDEFAIAYSRELIAERIKHLRDSILSDSELLSTYKLKETAWKLSKHRNEIRLDNTWQDKVIQCDYRPFDIRYTYYSTSVIDRPRKELLDNVVSKDNLCLNTTRQTQSLTWQHAIVSNKPTPAVYVEIKDGSNVFPLYLYPVAATPANLFDEEANASVHNGRRPNLAPEFIAEFSEKLGMEWVADGKGDRMATFGPEDVFDYLYAVFHSPAYRSRYAEFLKIDFPRLPLTAQPDLFRALCASGAELVALHLMERRAPGFAGVTFPEPGDNIVEKIRYDEPGSGKKGRVYLNAAQYFDGVAPEVWNFHVGGYQVCEKWLKDRKQKTLTSDDIHAYRAIAAALARTIELMAAIDEAIDSRGGWPLH